MINQIISESGLSYEVLSIIARGSQGTVYKVERKGKIYAIKLFHDISLDSWENIKLLVHHGAPRIASETNFIWPLHLVQSPSKGYIMQYLQASKYKSIGQLTDLSILSIVERFKISLQLLKSLLSLHLNTGLIFGDISPNNILIDPEHKTVRIIDTDSIGISKFDVLGTSGYMSRKTLEKQTLNFDSDVFAVYVMVIELILTRHPYDVELIEDNKQLIYEDRLNFAIMSNHHIFNEIKTNKIKNAKTQKTKALLDYFVPSSIQSLFIEMLDDEECSLEKVINEFDLAINSIKTCQCLTESMTNFCPTCLAPMENE
jgi:serine/threonine protein kinase